MFSSVLKPEGNRSLKGTRRT